MDLSWIFIETLIFQFAKLSSEPLPSLTHKKKKINLVKFFDIIHTYQGADEYDIAKKKRNCSLIKGKIKK